MVSDTTNRTSTKSTDQGTKENQFKDSLLHVRKRIGHRRYVTAGRLAHVRDSRALG